MNEIMRASAFVKKSTRFVMTVDGFVGRWWLITLVDATNVVDAVEGAVTRDGTVPVSIDVRVDAREAEDVPGTRQHGGISNCFATERTQTGVVGKGYALGVRRRPPWPFFNKRSRADKSNTGSQLSESVWIKTESKSHNFREMAHGHRGVLATDSACFGLV